MARGNALFGLFGDLVDIRREERSRLFPLAGAYGLILASIYVLKPARNALFLNHVGVEKLPYVLLLVALIGGIATTIYTRSAKSIAVNRLISWTLIAFIITLFGFRALLGTEGSWVFYTFYVWVNLFAQLATSLIWLLANATFNAKEARRVFGFIGTGGITGAIAGGLLTGRIVEPLGTENLLFVCAFLLFFCLILVGRVRPIESGVRRRRHGEWKNTAVLGTKLLRDLALTTGIISIVAVIVEIQFNDIVDRSFASKDQKTEFFGEFFAYLSAFAFLFQFFVTPRILRTRGVGTALMFLPVSLALGSMTLLVLPSLWAALFLKVGDGGLRHSIHKSATEVVFLPVPAETKREAKLFLDTTVDTFGTGAGALLVLLLTGTLGFGYLHLSFVTVALIVVCIFVGFRMRRSYVDAFRAALERREIDLTDVRMNIADASTVDVLLPTLRSQNDRQIAYALDMLSSARAKALIEPVRPLLGHPSADVRRNALRVLEKQDDPSVLPDIERNLVHDTDQSIRVEAIYFIAKHAEGDRSTRIKTFLEDPDMNVRAAALASIAQHGDLGARHLLDDALIRKFLNHEGEGREFIRAEVAGALGWIDDPALKVYLEELSRDDSPLVVARTIEAIGRTRDRRFVPWLIGKLTDNRHRVQARTALAAFGDTVVSELTETLKDPDVAAPLSRHVPRVLSEIPMQASVDALFELLASKPNDPLMVQNGIKALNRLRSRHPTLRFAKSKIDALLMAKASFYYALLQCSKVLAPGQMPRGDASELLNRAIEEKRQQTFEYLFRLLGLRYPPADMYNAYEGLISREKHVRASAFEFLDNVMSPKIKSYLFPLIEDLKTEEIIVRGHALFTERLETKDAALTYLASTDDPWLRACAIYSAAQLATKPQVHPLAERARNDRDPLVRETADLVLGGA